MSSVRPHSGCSVRSNDIKGSNKRGEPSSRILREQPLPSIRNKPVSPELYGDRDNDYDQDEVSKTIITSAITQDDIEFYEELERKQQESWKRRKKQDLEFMKESLRLKNSTIDINRIEEKKQRDKVDKIKSSSLFDDNNTDKDIYSTTIKIKPKNHTKNQLLSGYSSEED